MHLDILFSQDYRKRHLWTHCMKRYYYVLQNNFAYDKETKKNALTILLHTFSNWLLQDCRQWHFGGLEVDGNTVCTCKTD